MGGGGEGREDGGMERGMKRDVRYEMRKGGWECYC
jgi:hypothetical protein